MNLPAYFNRIGYTGTPQPNLDTLRALHFAHLTHVPFENLDIHWQRPIKLDTDWLFHKIVNERRGGFCYEQNGLFAAVLRDIGFNVTLLEARVPTSTSELGIRFDHLALIVNLEGRWLVDVGFGDSFLQPLRLDDPSEQQDYGRIYRVTHDGTIGRYEQKNEQGEWALEYQFELTPRQFSEFAEACHYHQTSPDSPFTHKRVCSMATPTGRITLSNDKLIITENGSRSETLLSNDSSIEVALQHYFKIARG